MRGDGSGLRTKAAVSIHLVVPTCGSKTAEESLRFTQKKKSVLIRKEDGIRKMCKKAKIAGSNARSII